MQTARKLKPEQIKIHYTDSLKGERGGFLITANEVKHEWGFQHVSPTPSHLFLQCLKRLKNLIMHRVSTDRIPTARQQLPVQTVEIRSISCLQLTPNLYTSADCTASFLLVFLQTKPLPEPVFFRMFSGGVWKFSTYYQKSFWSQVLPLNGHLESQNSSKQYLSGLA